MLKMMIMVIMVVVVVVVFHVKNDDDGSCSDDSSRPVTVDDGGSKYRLNRVDDIDDKEIATLMMKLIYPQDLATVMLTFAETF